MKVLKCHVQRATWHMSGAAWSDLQSERDHISQKRRYLIAQTMFFSKRNDHDLTHAQTTLYRKFSNNRRQFHIHGFCVFVQKFRENQTILCRVTTYDQNRCFPIWRPSAILNFGKITVVIGFSLPNLMIILSCFTEICRHNDFLISGSPPSWICGDVIILHPVIVFHGPNIAPQYRRRFVPWFRTNLTNARLTTDRQTDRQTSLSLKASSHLVQRLIS